MKIKFSIFSPSFLIIFFLLSHASLGQEIHGSIKDFETHKSLENVNIYLTENIKIGTVSDKNGFFSLSLNPITSKMDSLIFSMVGYKSKTIAVSSLMPKANTIFLSKKTNELNEITLSAKRKLQLRLKFNKLSSLQNATFSFGSIVVDNKIYVIGGDNSLKEDTFKKAVDEASMKVMFLTMEAIQNEWEPNGSWSGYSDNLLVYNIDKNTWEKKNIKLENRAYHQVNLYNNSLYVLGGKNIIGRSGKEFLHNKIEIFNKDSLHVIVDNTNPHQAVNFASFVYDDNLILMGGSTSMKKDGSKTYTDKVHHFNFNTGYWYDLASMVVPKEVSGVIIKNKIYLIGGFNGKPISSIESFDVITGQWKKEGELFHGAERPALTFHDNIIYIFNNGKINTFNIATKNLKEYEISLYLKNSNLHYYNNKLYILGGYREKEYSKEPSSGLYVVDLKEFSKTRSTQSKSFK